MRLLKRKKEIKIEKLTSRPLRIGTSGWQYDGWQGDFYPQDLPNDEWLAFYAKHFDTVEINNTFYQLPAAETLINWYENTPDDFIFSVKANRYITHMKKLKEPEDSLNRFLERVQILDDKLGPILFQLPPNWYYDGERLANFLDLLPPDDFCYVMEFRDPDWLRDEAYELLQQHDTAFCIYDIHQRTSPRRVTTDFVYVRLHGPLEEAYKGAYNTETLSGWAGAFSSWQRDERTIFCYFDNTMEGDAIHNAQQLKNMLIEE